MAASTGQVYPSKPPNDPVHRYLKVEDADSHNWRKDQEVASEKPSGPFSRAWTPIRQCGAVELVSLCLSVIAMAAMVVLLSDVSGHPLPAWTQTFSLNAVISIIGTAASFGIFQGAQHAIGQLKWLHFAKADHSLYDMKAFDSGSRGPTGALRLLLRQRMLNLVVLATAVVTLRAAFDPFLQNLVQYYEDTIPSGAHNATLGRNNVYESYGPAIGGDGSNPDIAFNMKGNIYTSIYQPLRPELLQPQFTCPTGNCTWDPFTTLAFCPLCTNVNSRLSVSYNEDGTLIAQFPEGGPSLFSYLPGDDQYAYLNMTKLLGTMTDPAQGLVYNNSLGAIWQFIRADVTFQSPNFNGIPDEAGLIDDPKLTNTTKFIGYECSMAPCVQSLQANVSNGSYSEQVLDMYMELEDGSLELNPPWGPEQGMKQNETFAIGAMAYNAFIRGSFNSFFNGSVTSGDGATSYMFEGGDEIEAILYTNFTGSFCSDDPLVCMFNAFGSALTKSVRDAPIIENGTDAEGLAVGNALQIATFVRVRWIWLSLPVLLLILSFVAWIGTFWAARQRRLPLWGNNVLPLLYLYRENIGKETSFMKDDPLKDDLIGNHDNSISAYEEKAKTTNVELVFSGPQPRLREFAS